MILWYIASGIWIIWCYNHFKMSLRPKEDFIVNEEKIIEKLLEHDDKFIILEQKMDRHHNETNGHLGEIMVVLNRLDQERIFTTEWIKRIDKRVEKLENE